MSFSAVPLAVSIIERTLPKEPSKQKKEKTETDPAQTPKRAQPKKKPEPKDEVVARIDIHSDDDKAGKSTFVNADGLSFLIDETDDDFDELVTCLTSIDRWRCSPSTELWMRMPDGHELQIGRYSKVKHAVKLARSYQGVVEGL